jgi:HSP20 family protein
MRKEESKGLVKAGPTRMLSPFEAMERRFEEFFRRPFSMRGLPWWSGLEGPEGEITPSVDIYEEGGDVVMKAELPGMKKEDIEVRLTDDSITISGEKKKEEKVEKKGYYRLERSHGSFTRSFALPSEVRTDDVKAKFKEGVLEIRIPKTDEAKKKVKKVSIE